MYLHIKQTLIIIALCLLVVVPAAGARPDSSAGEFRVKGVLISPNNRSALIDNTVAKVGDTIAGAEILAIDEDKILILRGTQKLVVQVGSSAAYGSPVGALLARSAQPAREHEVRSGDTLSAIAEQYAGDGVSLNQVMSALFDANPDAFDGNVNRLRAGSVLRIPEQAVLQSRSHGRATAMILQHQSAWQSGAKIPQMASIVAEPREYGPVQRGETLSGIAVRVREDGVSMQRMMSAIYDANPDAFGRSMDFLREGATLQIPDVSTNYEQLAAAL